MPAIHIHNLGKKFRIHTAASSYLSLRDVVSNPFQRRFTGKRKEDFWALKEIDLNIEQGERIGIIGRNGAGKSTLLKIISRITPPTTGSITINGRVASLLEVGTGFHPELTGRENIFFNGSVLGMRKREITARLDEIIAFSGVEKFIDTPLKQYSSGMQLRLAFSVAAHLEPEILLIDEVLAVGDAEFQKKCIGKMEAVSRQEGRTILFVSHNMSYLLALCSKGLLLEGGMLVKTGSITEVAAAYRNTISQISSSRVWNEKERPGSPIVQLHSVSAVDASWVGKSDFSVTGAVGILMEYEVLQDGQVLWLGHNIHNDRGDNIFDTHSVDTELYQKPHAKGVYQAVAWIPQHLLNTGSYIVSTAIFNHTSGVVHLHERDVLLFQVHDELDALTARGQSPGEFPGLVRPLLTWTIKKQ